MARALKTNFGKVIRHLQQQKKDIERKASDLQAQVATRLLELLIQRTPVKTGELVGGWTAQGGVTGRLNPQRLMPAGERKAIIRQSRSGVNINIDNAVEYVRVLNYGLKGFEPRQFIELSVAQLLREYANTGIVINIS